MTMPSYCVAPSCVFPALAALALLAASQCRAQQCVALPADPSPAQGRAFLTDHPPEDRRDPPCTELAIRAIGSSPETHEAVPILLRYLTFKREPTQAESAGSFSMRLWYPAVDALNNLAFMSRGSREAVTVAMVKYLSEPLTDLSKENSLMVLEYIFRSDPADAVRFVTNERKALERSAAKLKSVAAALAKQCPATSKQACEEALGSARR